MGTDKIAIDYETLDTAAKDILDGQERTQQTQQNIKRAY